MTQFWGRCAIVLLLSSTCLVGMAEEKTSKRMTKSAGKADDTAVKIRGRLPKYFSSIVDQNQRVEIYEIRAAYREEIAELEKQLADLAAAEMQDVEKVLTSGQRKKLEEMRERSPTRSSKSASKEKLTSRTSKAPSTKSKSKSRAKTKAKPKSNSNSKKTSSKRKSAKSKADSSQDEEDERS